VESMEWCFVNDWRWSWLSLLRSLSLLQNLMLRSSFQRRCRGVDISVVAALMFPCPWFPVASLLSTRRCLRADVVLLRRRCDVVEDCRARVDRVDCTASNRAPYPRVRGNQSPARTGAQNRLTGVGYGYGQQRRELQLTPT
jgi:hypothetical protein